MLRPTGKNSKGYANRMPEQTNGEGETRKKENIPRKSNSRGKREKKAGQGEKWKAKQIRPFLGDQARVWGKMHQFSKMVDGSDLPLLVVVDG